MVAAIWRAVEGSIERDKLTWPEKFRYFAADARL
jgi:hypothetical protein